MYRGPFIITASGAQFPFWPLNKDAVRIEDIARSLSNTCRFNGHLPEGVHYSVAQHSCIVALITSREMIKRFGPLVHADKECNDMLKAALLHDAPEAYLADLPGPFKSGYNPEYVKQDKPPKILTEGVAMFREFEDMIFSVIAEKFEIPKEVPELVHYVDRSIVFPMEWHALKLESIEAGIDKSILPRPMAAYENIDIKVKGAQEAEREFLELWESLCNYEITVEEGPDVA